MNGRLVLLLCALAVVAVLVLAGDDVTGPIRRLFGTEEAGEPFESGDPLTSDGPDAGPLLEGAASGPPGSGTAATTPVEEAAPARTGPLQSRARGVLRLPGGGAARGVRVRLVGAGGTFEFTTDAEGRFDHAVPVGVYRATFVADGIGGLVVPALVVDGSGSESIGAFDLEATLEVDVLVRQDGGPASDAGAGAPQPVVGVRVVLRPTDRRLGGFAREATTGGSGLALFTDVLPGSSEIVVAMGAASQAVHAVVIDGTRRTIEVRLPGTVNLQGTVRAAAEGPGVGGARVSIETAALRGETRYLTQVETNYAGTFEVPVPRGRGLVLEIQAEGYARWPASAQGRAHATRVLYRLREKAPVVLEAILERGISLRGSFRVPSGVTPPRESLAFALTSGPFSFEGVSDANGVFEVPDLTPGQYRLQMRAAGWTLPPYWIGIQAEQAPVFDVGDVLLRPARVLQGRVLAASGGPVAGARVWLASGAPDPAGDSEAQATTFSDGGGAWLLRDVPVGGVLDLRASFGDSISAPLAVGAGSADSIDLRLVDPGRVQGVIHVAGGEEPLAGIPVRARRVMALPTVDVHATTDAQGAFLLSPLVPGTWLVSVESADYLPVEARTLDVRAEAPVILAFALDPGLVFAGRCLDEAGAALSSVKIHVRGESVDGATVTRTVNAGSDGRFRVGGLPEGRYELRALKTGYRVATRSQLGRSEADLEVVLRP